MSRMHPESRAIQKNIARITLQIANTGSVRWFSQQLVENDFIASQTASSMTDVLGISNFDKASRLMGAVESRVATAASPEKEFKIFMEILKSNVATQEVAEQIIEKYREFGGIWQDVSPSVSSTQSGATTTVQEPSSEADIELCEEHHVDISDYLLILDKKQLYDLGLTLGLLHQHLRNLMDSPMFLDDLIAAWLRKEDAVGQRFPPTWRNLVRALRAQRVRQHGIADRISRDKCQ